jgi:hypothetical protein
MLPAPTVHLPRRVADLLVLLLLTVPLLAAGTGTADAAVGYKYWNYFHVTAGKYVFASTGPAGYVPRDGSVEAYRYGLSSTAAGLAPRTDATTYAVDDICKGVSAKAGEKKVGVLIDYGTASDAGRGEQPAKPRAACAVVPGRANGQQVLDAVADVRLDKQLLCGIDGYPVKSCSVTARNAPPAAKQQQVDFVLPATSEKKSTSGAVDDGDDGGVPWPLVGVAAAVVVIGGGALALSRRSKRA